MKFSQFFKSRDFPVKEILDKGLFQGIFQSRDILMKGFFVLGTFRFQFCLTLFSTLKNWKMVRKRRSSAKNAFFFFVGTLCNLQFFRNFSVTKVVLLTFEIYSKLDYFEFLAPKIIKKLPKNEN